ncbi:transferrin-binding protein-like solute binding protein [Providencia alcalifaciens]|uniref:Slam-dependent surface lipoprotein n=1 Tax=Providencia alcalifaciens TaxID=126385 RepID=UPI001CE07D47|nr:Slam-dependent surface lipoprotein [Providencia alcalifaciens]UBX48512.1 transferrin-binding protein-like solute binding protein [Providencia alcalifaciens]
MNKSTKFTLIAMLVGVSTCASAVTESAQSQTYETERSDITIGETQVAHGPFGGEEGSPGVGYRYKSEGKRISFSGLTKMIMFPKEGNVYVINGTPHRDVDMGKFQFSKVADAEVYYGDWSQTGKEDDAKHTAFFSGLDATTAVPTEGKATYTIAGINQYDGEKQLSGVFEADFGDKDYTGSLQGEDLKIALEGKIQDAGSFSGSAIANDTVTGMNYGRFFGENAEHVAGVAVFNSDHQYDTAFGGSQNQE